MEIFLYPAKSAKLKDKAFAPHSVTLLIFCAGIGSPLIALHD